MDPLVNQDVFIRRGDTKKLKFAVDTTKLYPIAANDQVYFTVKKTSVDSAFVFQKSIGHGITVDAENYCHLKIDPVDTDGLTVRTYEYDIEVVFNGFSPPEKYTIAMGKCVIGSEITSANNEV